MNGQLATQPAWNALVYGKEYTHIPEDLFIPPQALEVLLDSFSGPLDLLLYLIRKQNIDILDIPIVTITNQYMHYIDALFQTTTRSMRQLELAGDYLLMATVLAEIKSKFLLPITPSLDAEEEVDPRMELIKRLQAYEEIKQAAYLLDMLPRHDREYFSIQLAFPEEKKLSRQPQVAVSEVQAAMATLLQRAACLTYHQTHHEVSREVLSVRDRMRTVLIALQTNKVLSLTQLFLVEEGRAGLIVSFLAILELAKQSFLVITQAQAFSPVYVQAVPHG